MKNVVIYTDGACSGNPGVGGWGAILMYASAQKEISGADPHSTNNRMELTAVIEALKCLKEPCKVDIYQFPYTKEFYATVPEGYKEWHIQNYGSIEEFFKQAWGFYAVDNGKVCAESEGAFMSGGYAEMGIYTFEEYRNRGFAYALCLRTIQELEKMGIKPIWACDKANVESDRLAQRLGYVNPVEYEFVYLEPPK